MVFLWWTLNTMLVTLLVPTNLLSLLYMETSHLEYSMIQTMIKRLNEISYLGGVELDLRLTSLKIFTPPGCLQLPATLDS